MIATRPSHKTVRTVAARTKDGQTENVTAGERHKTLELAPLFECH